MLCIQIKGIDSNLGLEFILPQQAIIHLGTQLGNDTLYSFWTVVIACAHLDVDSDVL